MKRNLHIRTRVNSANGRRRGAAATEAAVVLPLLLTISLAAFDFGRIFGLSAQLSNAVQAGAESAATHRPSTLAYDSWITKTRTAVLDELSDTNDFDLSKVTVTIDLLTDQSGTQRVRVVANYPFKTLVQWPLIPNQVSLQSKLTMRQYR